MVTICSPLFFPFMICYIAVEQMLVHFYTERMLFLCLCLREAINLLFWWLWVGVKEVFWSPEDIRWIKVMDHLMTLMFGQDFIEYTFDAKKTCHMRDDFLPKFKYSREEWLSEYADMLTGIDDVISVENGMCPGKVQLHL